MHTDAYRCIQMQADACRCVQTCTPLYLSSRLSSFSFSSSLSSSSPRLPLTQKHFLHPAACNYACRCMPPHTEMLTSSSSSSSSGVCTDAFCFRLRALARVHLHRYIRPFHQNQHATIAATRALGNGTLIGMHMHPNRGFVMLQPSWPAASITRSVVYNGTDRVINAARHDGWNIAQ